MGYSVSLNWPHFWEFIPKVFILRASQLRRNVIHFHYAFNLSLSVNSLLCLFKWSVFKRDTELRPADTLQTFTKLNTGNGRRKKRLIMNSFSLIHMAKIFYLQHISVGLYIQLMRFQINVKWTAFKLLFSLEAWHWRREGFHQMTEELLPDPLRSVNRAIRGNAISAVTVWGLETFNLVKVRCGREKRRGGKGCQYERRRRAVLNSEYPCVLMLLSHKRTVILKISLTSIFFWLKTVRTKNPSDSQ